jgi:hypothetical protein
VGKTTSLGDEFGGIAVRGGSDQNAGCTIPYSKSIDSRQLRSWEFVVKLETYGGYDNGRFWEVRKDNADEWNICPANSGGALRLWNSVSSSHGATYSDKGVMPLHQYVHMVLTYDPISGTVNNYRNGVLVGSARHPSGKALFDDGASVRAIMGAANGRTADRHVNAEVRSVRAYTDVIDQPTAERYAKEAAASMFTKGPTHLMYKDGYDIFYVPGVSGHNPSTMYDACEAQGGRSVGNYVRADGRSKSNPGFTDRCGSQVVVLSNLAGMVTSANAYATTDHSNTDQQCNEVVYCKEFETPNHAQFADGGSGTATIGNYGVSGSCSSGYGPFIGSHGISWNSGISNANVICARTPGCTRKDCIDWSNTGPNDSYRFLEGA